MLDIESVKTEDLESIAPWVPKLFEKVKPLLERVDKSLLSESSGVTVHLQGRDPYLLIVIEPNQSDIPGASLYAARDQCILALFGNEHLEDFNADTAPEVTIEMVCSDMSRYLEGITVVYYYARNRKPVKREDYFGIERTERTKAGTAYCLFPFFRRIVAIEEKSFRFITTPTKGIQQTLARG